MAATSIYRVTDFGDEQVSWETPSISGAQPRRRAVTCAVGEVRAST